MKRCSSSRDSAPKALSRAAMASSSLRTRSHCRAALMTFGGSELRTVLRGLRPADGMSGGLLLPPVSPEPLSVALVVIGVLLEAAVAVSTVPVASTASTAAAARATTARATAPAAAGTTAGAGASAGACDVAGTCNVAGSAAGSAAGAPADAVAGTAVGADAAGVGDCCGDAGEAWATGTALATAGGKRLAPRPRPRSAGILQGREPADACNRSSSSIAS